MGLRSLEQIQEDARIAVELDPVRLRLESADRDECHQLLKAIRLSPSLEVCEALLRDQHVPPTRLDPEWVRAYGGE